MGQERKQGRRIGRGAGWDDEKDVRHRGIEQRAGFLERARDENFGAGFLERAPNGLRHVAARAKEKEGPHAGASCPGRYGCALRASSGPYSFAARALRAARERAANAWGRRECVCSSRPNAREPRVPPRESPRRRRVRRSCAPAPRDARTRPVGVGRGPLHGGRARRPRRPREPPSRAGLPGLHPARAGAPRAQRRAVPGDGARRGARRLSLGPRALPSASRTRVAAGVGARRLALLRAHAVGLAARRAAALGRAGGRGRSLRVASFSSARSPGGAGRTSSGPRRSRRSRPASVRRSASLSSRRQPSRRCSCSGAKRKAGPLVLAVLAGVILSIAIWVPVFRSSGGFSGLEAAPR